MTLRMLVVDDEESILFAMRQYFTPLGFEVDCAREREEAEALLTKMQYSVVVADLRLAGTDGREGFEVISCARDRSVRTRTILLTAYGSPEVEAEARRRGVDAFLQKLQPLPELARIIRAALEREP